MISAVGFAAQAVENPSRYYRRPDQVVRDRRLARNEKLAVLEAWETRARALAVAEDNMGAGEPSLLQEVAQARMSLGEHADAEEDADVSTKSVVRNARTGA